MTSASGLSQVECHVNESNEDTKDSVQVCSILHVAHVHVRRVIHVIVHYGLTDVEGVLVVVHTLRSHLRSHLFVNCCIRRYSLYTPVGDSRLLSAVTDIYIYIYIHDKFCIQLLLRFIPQMNSCPLSTQVFRFNQWSLHLCGEFS